MTSGENMSMKLKLFGVKRVSTNKVLDRFFSSKVAAKAYRDELGKELHAVILGPDHRKNQGRK
jgi:hypothetical protein